MATTTEIAVPNTGAWVLAYTAAGTVNLFVQGRSAGADLLVRVGSATATSDSADAAAEVLYAREGRTLALASGDKVHVRSPNGLATKLTLRV
jgi:hypothetical protein